MRELAKETYTKVYIPSIRNIQLIENVLLLEDTAQLLSVLLYFTKETGMYLKMSAHSHLYCLNLLSAKR